MPIAIDPARLMMAARQEAQEKSRYHALHAIDLLLARPNGVRPRHEAGGPAHSRPSALPDEVAGLAGKRIPASRLAIEKAAGELARISGAPPESPADERTHRPEGTQSKTTREPRRHRHHLAHDEKSQPGRHAHAYRIGNLNPTAAGGRLLRGG